MERNRTYECMCLLDNREVRKGWESLKDAVAGLFTKHGAKVLSNRRWDERRLAYPIDGQIRATYLLMYFSMDTQSIPALRRDLQFSEPMLRYMITECSEVPADAYEPEAEFDVNAIPEDDAPEPAAAEEEEKAEGDAKEGDAKEGDAKEGDAKEGDAADADATEEAAKEEAAKDGDAADADATEEAAKEEAAKDGDAEPEKAEADAAPVADAVATDGEENK